MNSQIPDKSDKSFSSNMASYIPLVGIVVPIVGQIIDRFMNSNKEQKSNGDSFDRQEYEEAMNEIKRQNSEYRKRQQEFALENERLRKKLDEFTQDTQSNISVIDDLKEQIERNNQEQEQLRQSSAELQRTVFMLKQDQKMYEERAKMFEKLNKDFQEQIKRLREEARESKNIDKFKQNKEKGFQLYLDKVKMRFDEEMPHRHKGEQGNIVMLGKISSGKSSLINCLYGLKLEVGVGETTKANARVAQSTDSKVKLWDCPGIQDEEFSLFDPKHLLFFNDADLVILLYSDSIKSIKQFVQAMYKLKPNHTILVRTKCDLWSKEDKKTIEQEIQTDYEKLKEWGMKFKHRIYATSSKQGLDFRDNGKLKELIENAKIHF